MNWITNHPKSVKGMWPRRAGVDYREGVPKETATYTSEQLAAQGLVGVYVDIPMDEYYQKTLVANPAELKALK